MVINTFDKECQISGARANASNIEGLQNGMRTDIVPIPEATHPSSRPQSAPKTPSNTNGAASQCREQDQYLPTANVVRIMRRALPPHAKVADEAKELMQECVSEFISFITTEANDTCRNEHRKTVTAEDLIGAMSKLGFDHYADPLMSYLLKYRDNEMLPTINRYNVPYGPNNGPSYDSVPSGLFPFGVPTVGYPQCDVFGYGNGGYYYDRSGGQSSGAGYMGQDFGAGIGYGENGPGLARGMNGEQSGGDGTAGPSGLPQAKMGFYDQ